MPRQRPNDEYYTASQVKAILGIKNSTLYNYVYKGVLRRIIPYGMKQGMYLREEVDELVRQRKMYFSATQPETTAEDKERGAEFMIATLGDMDGVYELAARLFPRTMGVDLRRAWLAKNPQGNYVVKKDNRVVAYFYLQPLAHDLLVAYLLGGIRGWDITADDIEPFEPERPVECMLGGIGSDPELNEATRSNCVMILLRGVMRDLERLGSEGIIIPKVYAYSDTPGGIAMCMHLGMKQYTPPQGKRFTFEMNTETSRAPIVRGYQRGLAQWRKKHQGDQ